MRIDILTLFPAMFQGPLSESIIGRAVDQGILDIRIHDIRAFATDKHRTVDDYPFGGGAGMVMKPEPLFAAIEACAGDEEVTEEVSKAGDCSEDECEITVHVTRSGRRFRCPIILTPQESIWKQLARRLAEYTEWSSVWPL